MFKILVVGNLDNGEFLSNVTWFESQNYKTLLPDFIGAIEPDTIGVWKDSEGKSYKDAGKWYRFMLPTKIREIKNLVSVIARMTNQTCILVSVPRRGYALIDQQGKIEYIGKTTKVVDKGLFDETKLSSYANATYDIRLSRYWIAA